VAHTVQLKYQGWDIIIRCMDRLRPIDEINFVTAYSAIAHAALQESENPAQWVDPRVQIVTLGTREFANGEECIRTLTAEVMALIDALKR